MSKHIRVRYKGLRERRRWWQMKCVQAFGLTPPTITEARKLWVERRAEFTPEEWAELRRRYAEERAT